MADYLRSRTVWSVLAALVFFGAAHFTGQYPDLGEIAGYCDIIGKVVAVLAVIFARFKRAEV